MKVSKGSVILKNST